MLIYKFKKMFTVLLSITVLLLLIVGYGIVYVGQSDVRKVISSGELNENFTSFKELKKEAEMTIEGKVLEQETIVHGNLPFTISKVEIVNKYKGKVKKGDIIQVIETGGIYEPAGKNGEKLNKVELKLNNVSTLKPEEHVFLFLRSFSGPQVEGAHIPLGAYQGKFKVNKDGKVKQQANEEYKLIDFTEEKIETFKEKVKGIDK